MWIRSQDGTKLSPNNGLFIAENGKIFDVRMEHKFYDNGIIFGQYKSEKRCIEILDEIQAVIKNRYETFTNKEEWDSNSNTYGIVYEMPKE